jgi:dTDP-4-dehydrorhamnose reductase
MNPILSTDLAKITIQLVSRCTGLWHVAGDTCVTKYEFARRIASYFGLENLVEPKTSEEMNQKAKRPKNGCLDCSELEKIVRIDVPSFDSGMAKFLSMEYYGTSTLGVNR